jgi:hypothetical protein
MTDEDISERNGYLISLIRELNLGIHVIDLPHKPKMISEDYKFWFNGYVNNFTLILKPAEFTQDIYFEVKLRSIEKMDVDAIKQKFVEWIEIFNHKRIYTLIDKESGMFVTGFNHHNKILKIDPYPVFSKYSPITYYELEKAELVQQKFNKYNLIIN